MEPIDTARLQDAAERPSLKVSLLFGAGAGMFSILLLLIPLFVKDKLILSLIAGGAVALAVLAWLGFRYRTQLMENKAKLFIVVYLIGENTRGVAGVKHFDLGDISVFLGFVGLFVLIFARERKFHLTPLDFLNGCLLATIFLSMTVSIVNVLLVALFMKSLMLAFVISNIGVKRDNMVFLMKTFVILAVISALIGVGQEIIYQATKYPLAGFNIEQKDLNQMFVTNSLEIGRAHV